jgi:AcrR family transcriptional regulator
LNSQPIETKPAVFRPRAHRRKLESRGRILTEARRLFGRRGFNAVTTAEIAAAAEVAKGSVFAHVGSKERLLVLVFQRDMNKWLDDAEARAGRGALIEQLCRFFEAMLDGAAAAPELTAVFMREMPYAHAEPEVQATRARTDVLLGGLIDAAKARGEIAKAVDTLTLSRNLFALYFFYQFIWLAADRPAHDDMQPTLRERLEMQLRGLRPRK